MSFAQLSLRSASTDSELFSFAAALGKVEGADRFERQITNDKADEKDSSDQTSPTL